MIQSKFRLWALLPLLFSFLLIGFLCYFIKTGLTDPEPLVVVVAGVMTVFFFSVWIWVVFGELRTKAVSVILSEDTIAMKGFLGLGPYRRLHIKELEGFTTSVLSSNGGDYEYLYLMKGNRKMAKLSEYYHSNYFEMKAYLAARMQFLGEKPFSLTADFKEIFQ